MSMSEEAKKKLSKRNEGNQYRKGIPHSAEEKRKMSEKRKKRIGKKAPNWQGGITPIPALIRTSNKYDKWKLNIFIRDNFTCQECGQVGGELVAHHKKPFSKLFTEARKYIPLLNLYDSAMIYAPLWDVSNGKTLCNKCHKKIKK